jgi:hypothetical protein
MFKKRFRRLIPCIHPSISDSKDDGGEKTVSPAISIPGHQLVPPHAEASNASEEGKGGGGKIHVSSDFESVNRTNSIPVFDSLSTNSALKDDCHNQNSDLGTVADKGTPSQRTDGALDPLATQLKSSTEQFFKNYSRFLSKHKQYIKPEEEVQCAIRHAQLKENIWDSARNFENEVKHVLQIKNRREDLSKSKWRNRLGRFITTLFPVARVTLQFTGMIAEVYASKHICLLCRVRTFCLSKPRRRVLGLYYRHELL